MHQSKTEWNFIVNCKSNHHACENEIDRLHEHAERVYDASIVGKKVLPLIFEVIEMHMDMIFY